MRQTVTPELTIQGDRQAGKTEALTRIAAADATNGRRVLFGTYRWSNAREAFDHITQQIPRELIQRTRRSSGQLRIELTNGGLIDVRAVTTTGHRGILADTAILDDAHRYEDQIASAIASTNGSAHPRIYVSRCTEDA